MKDKNKTKAQLIDELIEMRQRVFELKSSESERTGELAKSEARYRQLVENPLIGVWQADTKGRFVFINKRLAEMSGYSQDEVIGMSMMAPIAPELRSWLAERMQKRKAGKLPPDVVEAEMVRKDGSRYTALVAPAAFYDEEEKFNGFIGSMIDITERKRADEELKIKDSAIASAINAIAMADLEGNLTYVNNAFVEMWGYDDENEVLGKYAAEFWQREERASEVIEALRDKGSWVGELVAIKKNGSMFDVHLSANMVRHETGRPICMMSSFVDITERKKAEVALWENKQKLEHQAQRLEEVNTALKVLLEHREEEKKKFEENILLNVQKLIFPYIEKLENSQLDDKNQGYIDIIRSNLKDLISPFANTLSSKYSILTSTEIQVADHIKHGGTSKEIASLLNVSPKAVSFHRGNIRRKLGLVNKKINLRSYLQSLAT